MNKSTIKAYDPYSFSTKEKIIMALQNIYQKIRLRNLFDIREEEVNSKHFINIALSIHLVILIVSLIPYDLFMKKNKPEIRIKAKTISSKELHKILHPGGKKNTHIDKDANFLDNIVDKIESITENANNIQLKTKKPSKPESKPTEKSSLLHDIVEKLEDKHTEGKTNQKAIKHKTKKASESAQKVNDLDGVSDVDDIDTSQTQATNFTAIVSSFFHKCWMKTEITNNIAYNDIGVQVKIFFDASGKIVNYDVISQEFENENERMYYNHIKENIVNMMDICDKVDNLPNDSYEQWKEVILTFKYSSVS